MLILRRCRRPLTVIAVLSGALVLAPANATAAIELKTKLRGFEEVPGPGAADGKGRAVITLRRAQKKVCFELVWRGIQQPIAGHIHRGDDGAAGPVKVTLFDYYPGLPGPTAEGCVEGVRKRLIKRMRKRSEQYYVNIHNAQFPDGSLRGQLPKRKRPPRRNDDRD